MILQQNQADWCPVLTLFIGVKTLIRGLLGYFIGYKQVMASLIVYGDCLDYGTWFVQFLEMHCTSIV